MTGDERSQPDWCVKCGDPIYDPAEAWPYGDGGLLCQDCWEDHSARFWWEVLSQLELDGGPRT